MTKQWVVVMFDDRRTPPVHVYGIYEDRQEAINGRWRAFSEYHNVRQPDNHVRGYVLPYEKS